MPVGATGRHRSAAIGVALVAVIAACANGRDDSARDATIPRITPASTSSTVAPDPTPFVPTTAATTLPPAPPPTSFTTAAPVAPAATPLPTNATQPAPTTTLVVTPGSPRDCTAEAIAADTGIAIGGAVSCWGGFALGVTNGAAHVFHVTGAGWVHDGELTACSGLVTFGMTAATAATFDPECGDYGADPLATSIIRPDSTGDDVRALQTALVGEGYEIAIDGRYGPRTEAAVRDVQARHGLEVDGIAGPRTQFALEIGPDPDGGQAPTTTPPGGSAATSSVAVTAGEPPACTAAAIADDTDLAVRTVDGCAAGWATATIEACPPQAVCEEVEVFHVTDGGWVHDGRHSSSCAESLADAGMSPYTAGELATFCAGEPPTEREIIRPDSQGPLVEMLQIALVAGGYPIAVDGTYGPRTQAAVRDYQQRNGLDVDGIAGPRTRKSLGI